MVRMSCVIRRMVSHQAEGDKKVDWALIYTCRIESGPHHSLELHYAGFG